ncbi:MAG: HypC/HybG/HupF family hydrogenase formation chaperone [Pirellulaceae bacterium]
MCLGIPGRVLEIIPSEQDSAMRMGKVEFGGIAKDICLAYLPDVEVGDYVLVHVGFAISRLDEEEAGEIFSYIEQLGELSDMNDPFAGSDPSTGVGRIENASEENP